MNYEPLQDSDFLYASLPDGKIVLSDICQIAERTFDRTKCACVHNPPQYPSEVNYCISTDINYELTFQNPVPKEWLDSKFYLKVGDLVFHIDSTYFDMATQQTEVRAITFYH